MPPPISAASRHPLMPLLPSRRLRRSLRAQWCPGKPVYTVIVVGLVAILALSCRSFYNNAVGRGSAPQQLKAAKQERAAAKSDSQHGAAASAGGDAVGTAADGIGSVATGDPAQLQQYCEQHFGLEWLRRWQATAQKMCTSARPAPGGAAGGEGGSTVTCRSFNDTHMPAASSPHVLCDATNLRLDPSKLRRARCPRHRPGYLCASPTYYHFERGAWAVDCSWPRFSLQAFSQDHQQAGTFAQGCRACLSRASDNGRAGCQALRLHLTDGHACILGVQDIFEAMVVQPGPEGDQGALVHHAPAAVEELPTLLVTREIKEHANVFHTLTDLLNVYISLQMMGWQHVARQMVILDNHPPGPLDLLWPVLVGGPGTLAAVRQTLLKRGRHPWDAGRQHAGASGQADGRQGASQRVVRRVSDFQGPVLFRHAVFVPPGYTSLLFAHLYEDSSCPLPTTLFAGFRTWVLSSFGLGERRNKPAEAGGAAVGAAAEAAGSVLTVRLISRRPSMPRSYMARRISNEREVQQAVTAVADQYTQARVAVAVVDFAQLSVEQQLTLVSSSDVLVGMHGAALAYSLLLPPHAALVELWPQAEGIWRCYEHFAQWAGVLYRRVANSDPARHRNTALGDITLVDAAEVAQTVRELLPLVAQRRRQRLERRDGDWQQL